MAMQEKMSSWLNFVFLKVISSVFHSAIVYGKNECLNQSILQQYVSTWSWLWVLYIQFVEGIKLYKYLGVCVDLNL